MLTEQELQESLDQTPSDRWSLLAASTCQRLFTGYSQFCREYKKNDSAGRECMKIWWELAASFDSRAFPLLKKQIENCGNLIPHTEDYCSFWSQQAMHFVGGCELFLRGIQGNASLPVARGAMKPVVALCDFLYQAAGDPDKGGVSLKRDTWIHTIPLIQLEVAKVRDDVERVRILSPDQRAEVVEVFKREHHRFGIRVLY